MPEAPQMQALGERILAWLDGAVFEGYSPLGFSGLKTYDPPPEALIGAHLERVDRRAEDGSLWFVRGPRLVLPFLPGGRPHLAEPPPENKPPRAARRRALPARPGVPLARAR